MYYEHKKLFQYHVHFKGRGGSAAWGGLMFEILSKVQQIWYNCSSGFLDMGKNKIKNLWVKGTFFTIENL